jgi:hypothetical protein
VRKPEQKRISKWDKKADMGILIGYSNVGYRVLLDNRVIVARHVDIVERDVKCIGLGQNESDNEIGDSVNDSSDESENDSNMNNDMMKSEPNDESYRSKRTRNPPKKLDDYYVYNSSIFVELMYLIHLRRR